jgi:short-subunit dehydrogenase
MDLTDKRFLVAGATGALGSRLARGLHGAGARVALAGRDPGRLGALAAELGGAPSVALDLEAPAGAEGAVRAAADALGGLDGLVVATGTVAFGPAGELDDAVAARLLTVNALGPIALVRAALGSIGSPGAVVALSAVVADFPTAGMAAYSASKAALSGYLAALRRERRRDGLLVLDVRPPHLDTPFAERALAGSPPPLPAGADPDEVVAAILAALRDGRKELAYDLKARALVAS